MYNKTIIRFVCCDIGIIKASVSVVSLSRRLRLITPTSTLIIPDIRKTSSNKYGLLTKCEVKMAGYWPSSFFASLWTETKSRSINLQKKNEANIQPS